MKTLGAKAKELHSWLSTSGNPASEKDSANQIEFPSTTFCGPQVKASGLDKAVAGDRFRLAIEVVVRGVEQSTRTDGTLKSEVRMDLVKADLAKASGKADEDADGKDDDTENLESSDSEDSGDSEDTQYPEPSPVPAKGALD